MRTGCGANCGSCVQAASDLLLAARAQLDAPSDALAHAA